VLIYLLLADHKVEIVADRGINSRVNKSEWTSICQDMESQFRTGNFENGVLLGISAITALLQRHFPAQDHNRTTCPTALLFYKGYHHNSIVTVIIRQLSRTITIMCGICGELRFDGATPDLSIIKRMSAKVARRGPDHEAILSDGPMAFGHRRLAIIDLTPSADPAHGG